MTQQNVLTIQKTYAFFAEGNVAAILDLVSPEVTWELFGPPEIPTVGRFQGREGVAKFFQRVAETGDVLSFEPKEFIAGGDQVVAIIQYRARTKTTGRILDTWLIHVFTLRDGLIVDLRQYADTAASLAAWRASAAQA